MIEIALGLSITTFTLTISMLIYNYTKNKRIKDNTLKQTREVCKYLKTTLNDVDLSDESEERYEVDLSLQTYFQEKRGDIQHLIEKLREIKTFWLKEDKQANEFGDVLAWTIKEFYLYDCEEEERIRIWTKNIDEFHTKMTKALNKTETG